VTLSHGLLEVLEKNEEKDFHNILTGDKFWFYLKYPGESVLDAFRDEVPEKIKQKLALKVSDFSHLVHERNPQFAQCIQRHYTQ
jgi:hypothetical protein